MCQLLCPQPLLRILLRIAENFSSAYKGAHSNRRTLTLYVATVPARTRATIITVGAWVGVVHRFEAADDEEEVIYMMNHAELIALEERAREKKKYAA